MLHKADEEDSQKEDEPAPEPHTAEPHRRVRMLYKTDQGESLKEDEDTAEQPAHD